MEPDRDVAVELDEATAQALHDRAVRTGQTRAHIVTVALQAWLHDRQMDDELEDGEEGA